MKIGIVLSKSPAYSETFFNSKIKGLQKNGFKLVLFVNEKDKDFNLCDIKSQPKLAEFLRVLFILLFSFIKVVRFIKLEIKDKTPFFTIFKKIYLYSNILSSKKIDWLHFGFGTQAIGKENLAKAIRAKMAVSFRGFDIGVYPLKNKDCYKKLWNRVDKVHVISDDILNQCYLNGMSKKTLVEKITPAININIYSPTQKRNFNVITFLTVGRIHWKKGYIETLQALKKIKTIGVNFKYNIVGTGSKEELEQIKFFIHENDLSDSVFFTGKLSQNEVKEQYKNANYYIQYSVQEGFCNAVLEAQAMGLLCIVSNAEGLSENILNNKTGWVVKKYNSELLAEKIIEIINLSNKQKKEITFNAFKRVKEEFNLINQELKFKSFYTI